jgi:hypothetical protein
MLTTKAFPSVFQMEDGFAVNAKITISVVELNATDVEK